MYITRHKLEYYGACHDQVMLFNDLFPHGVELTEELCLLRAQVFEWPWAASCLLPSIAARVEYRRQEAPLLADHRIQVGLLLVEYRKQRAILLAEYKKQRAILLAEYSEQGVTLRAEYERLVGCARAGCNRRAALLLTTYREQQATLFYRCATQSN